VETEHNKARGQRSLPNRRKPLTVASAQRPVTVNRGDVPAMTSTAALSDGTEESVAAPSSDNSSGGSDRPRNGSSGSGHAPRLPSASYNSRGLLSESDKKLVTPFNAPAWKRMLNGHPDPALQARVLIGLSAGVDVQYRGPRDVSRPHVRNLPTALAHSAAVEADLAADVKLGRRAGPFKEPPLDHFIASPLGAVAKPGSDKIRIIHHLSYPFRGESVNKYVIHLACMLASFDDAARLVVLNGRGAMMSKIDVQAAYRCIPVRPTDWGLIGIIWKDEYYFDKVLPFGLGSSCALWEDFANALEWIIQHHAQIQSIIHYIDDTFLASRPSHKYALQQLQLVLAIYKILGVPVSLSKLIGPCTELEYLGILLNSVLMTARLSDARMTAIRTALDTWHTRETCTVTELQSLVGTLSFAAKVVRPGRIFLRRMLDLLAATNGIDSRSITLGRGFRADLQWWRQHMRAWNGVSVLYDLDWQSAKGSIIELNTDACEVGAGAVCGTHWWSHQWSADQLHAARQVARDGVDQPAPSSSPTSTGSAGHTDNEGKGAMPSDRRSMPYLELLALTMAAATWGDQWRGKRIRFFNDCEPIVHAVTKGTSRSPLLMTLIRQLFFVAAEHEFEFRVEHIRGVTNNAADALSRLDQVRFRSNSPGADHSPTIPSLPPVLDC
jgi:hypothetical protein